MAAQSDNLAGKNSANSLTRTGEGIILDIGTGDGRFVSASARQNPHNFYIGIDANPQPLEKVSMKATRKPSNGGLPNVLFVQAAVESLPEELNETADQIHIHFPWGSLLRAMILGEERVLASLRRISAPGCLLEIVIGIDQERDKTEIERLQLPKISAEYLEKELMPKYKGAGFKIFKSGILESAQWSKIETSWAKRLQGNKERKVTYLIFEAE